jgi:hypothetical protein
MSEVIELFPRHEELTAERELRWQIRRALATALGTFTRQPNPRETMEALQQMSAAMDLIQVHWNLTQEQNK